MVLDDAAVCLYYGRMEYTELLVYTAETIWKNFTFSNISIHTIRHYKNRYGGIKIHTLRIAHRQCNSPNVINEFPNLPSN